MEETMREFKNYEKYIEIEFPNYSDIRMPKGEEKTTQ